MTNADQDHVSDLEGLREHGVKVKTLIRNPHPNPVVLRQIKLEGGQLTDDMEYFLSLHQSYNQPVTEPFNDYMGGARVRTFYNTYPEFTCTNDLSLVTFNEYNGFKIIFPGDITKAGWLALIEQQAFCDELRGVTVMVASHHGRDNGYCAEVFDYCAPQAVIISDKVIQHATQKETSGYNRNHVISSHDQGVRIANLDYPRYFLTTRNDGQNRYFCSGKW